MNACSDKFEAVPFHYEHFFFKLCCKGTNKNGVSLEQRPVLPLRSKQAEVVSTHQLIISSCCTVQAMMNSGFGVYD